MDKYSKILMLALTSNNYKKAVSKYLLSFDLENWKIFADNFFKLSPYEAELIIDEIKAKMDIHMILDILSIAHIVGQSISLSNSLISSFTTIDISSLHDQIISRIEELLDSPFAEERRIGLFMVGYFDLDEFFDKIEQMSNYDILFEDAYFALGLMTNKKVLELLGSKFMYLGKNQVQRNVIAKILAQKGNPLAALWLFKNKGFDETTPITKSIYLSRDLAWAGIKPHLFIDTDDDFLQPMTLKMVTGLAVILPYDIELIEEIDLIQLIKKLVVLIEQKPSIELIKAIVMIKEGIRDLYFNLDPYAINSKTRMEIISSWKIIRGFPNNKIIHYIRDFVEQNYDFKSDNFITTLKLIKAFYLSEYEEEILKLLNRNDLAKEIELELISVLGSIGSEKSIDYLVNLLKRRIDFQKRSLLNKQIIQFHSDIDYYDDFENDEIRIFNHSFDDYSEFIKEGDYEDYFYWNCLYCLERLKSEKSIEIFIQALNDYDPKIRLEALFGLKALKVKNPEIEEKLLYMTQNESFLSVQREAIVTLGEINSQKAIPFFLNIIFDSIEDGTLAYVNDIIEEYDNRWELTEEEELSDSDDEIEATAHITNKNRVPKKMLDEDINRWIKRLNRSSSNKLELREDFLEKELHLTIDSEVVEDISSYNYIDLQKEENQKEEIKNIDEEEYEDDEWFTELGEKFKKLTIVESVLEALKITKAHIPIDRIRGLLEKPVDEELYKDVLIILAKRDVSFAINELYGLFNESDFIRAREILKTIKQLNAPIIKKFERKIINTPDWILKSIIHSKNQ